MATPSNINTYLTQKKSIDALFLYIIQSIGWIKPQFHAEGEINHSEGLAYAHDVFGGDRRKFREVALGEDDQIVDLATISGKEATILVIEVNYSSTQNQT